MLHIATLLGIASPLVLEHRLVVVFRSWATTALHLVLAFGIAAALYGLILLAITETYPPTGSLATVLYGFGLAFAGLLGICGGTLTAPERLARFTCLSAGTLAVLLPFGLYLQMTTAGEWQAGYLWYLVGGVRHRRGNQADAVGARHAQGVWSLTVRWDQTPASPPH